MPTRKREEDWRASLFVEGALIAAAREGYRIMSADHGRLAPTELLRCYDLTGSAGLPVRS